MISGEEGTGQNPILPPWKCVPGVLGTNLFPPNILPKTVFGTFSGNLARVSLRKGHLRGYFWPKAWKIKYVQFNQSRFRRSNVAHEKVANWQPFRRGSHDSNLVQWGWTLAFHTQQAAQSLKPLLVLRQQILGPFGPPTACKYRLIHPTNTRILCFDPPNHSPK